MELLSGGLTSHSIDLEDYSVVFSHIHAYDWKTLTKWEQVQRLAKVELLDRAFWRGAGPHASACTTSMFGKGRQRARAERAQSQLEERIRDVEAERDDLKVEVEELSKVGETFR